LVLVSGVWAYKALFYSRNIEVIPDRTILGLISGWAQKAETTV